MPIVSGAVDRSGAGVKRVRIYRGPFLHGAFTPGISNITAPYGAKQVFSLADTLSKRSC